MYMYRFRYPTPGCMPLDESWPRVPEGVPIWVCVVLLNGLGYRSGSQYKYSYAEKTKVLTSGGVVWEGAV